ncbi:MAG: uracil-DNA glycosylase [Chitinispirillales bacterium]|nr:uracil-DNA glycosylase [Chitinispirillales bacterium]
MNGRSLLAAYLRAQRDLGVEEFFFEHGSKVKTMLDRVDSSKSVNANGSAVSGRTTNKKQGSGSESRYVQPPVSVNFVSDSASSFSKLSKLKTVDPNEIKSYAAGVRRVFADAPMQTGRREKLAALYRETVSCVKCHLHSRRTKVVFGAGSADGKLFIIGEYPDDPQDDSLGLPFQGETGELYVRILEKMGLDKGVDVFATYLQKCRKDGEGSGGFDRECALGCRSLIDSQIEIIEPKALLVFGQLAANVLLDKNDDYETLRGTVHTYKGKPVIVTYSLPLMSKEPNLRTGAWEDMKRVHGII